jgi:predicted GIY-YIG superfamily endonuclease
MEMLIYKITNTLNKAIYIGKCKNLSKRWHQHKSSAKKKNTILYTEMRKYGIKNFTIKILEHCETNNVDYKEKHWIQKLKPQYNMTKGGNGGGFLNKKHTSKWHKIIKKSNSKPVACYSLDGILIKVFSSCSSAGCYIGKSHKGISACIRGEYNTCGGYQWIQIYNKKQLPKKIKKYNRVSHKRRKIKQYSLDNKYIGMYDSILEASQKTNSDSGKITLVCQNLRKTHNNFIWKYA